MAKITQRELQVHNLRTVKKLSFQLISVRFGLNREQVKQVFYRADKKIRQALSLHEGKGRLQAVKK